MAGEFHNITDALKIAYPPKVVEPMVNEETPFRRQVQKSVPADAKPTEAIVKFGGNLNPPMNFGNTVDGGTLPTPKDRTDVQFQLTPVLFAGAMTLGYITQSAADSNKSAFNGGEVMRRTKETLVDLAKWIERLYVATHGTGRIAQVEANTTNANTFTAALPVGTRLIRENMMISVRTTDGGNTVSGTVDNLKVTDVNHSTRVVTFAGDGTHDLTAGHHVYVVVEAAQSFTTNPFPNGLRGLVDDGTFLGTVHGLSRTTFPKLKANVFGNGGTLRNLTEQLLIRACHEIRARSGKRITDIWTSEGQIEKYIEFVAPDRRLVVTGKTDTQNMVTGYKGDELVHYAPGIAAKINLSWDLVPRELYLINWDSFFHYQSKQLGWVVPGDQLWPTPTSGGYKASYLGYACAIENIGCDFFLANGVIRDLRDPSIGDA